MNTQFPSSRVKKLLTSGIENTESKIRFSKRAVEIAQQAAVMFVEYLTNEAVHGRVFVNDTGKSIQLTHLEAAVKNSSRLEFLHDVLADFRIEANIDAKEKELSERRKIRKTKESIDAIIDGHDQNIALDESESDSESSQAESELIESSESESEPDVIQAPKNPNTLFDSDEEKEEERRAQRGAEKRRKMEEKEKQKRNAQIRKEMKKHEKQNPTTASKRSRPTDGAIKNTPALTMFFKSAQKN